MQSTQLGRVTEIGSCVGWGQRGLVQVVLVLGAEEAWAEGCSL